MQKATGSVVFCYLNNAYGTIMNQTITPSFSKQKQILGLLAWLAVVFAVSALGALASINASGFYAEVIRPTWAPPANVFGPVWSALFFMMGISAWLVWRRGGFAIQGKALGVFLLQLAFNVLWSWLFFAWKTGGGAFADIIFLWALILTTIVLFWRVSRVAALLLVPYLLWVSFASVLNYTIWQTNPQLLG